MRDHTQKLGSFGLRECSPEGRCGQFVGHGGSLHPALPLHPLRAATFPHGMTLMSRPGLAGWLSASCPGSGNNSSDRSWPLLTPPPHLPLASGTAPPHGNPWPPSCPGVVSLSLPQVSPLPPPPLMTNPAPLPGKGHSKPPFQRDPRRSPCHPFFG